MVGGWRGARRAAALGCVVALVVFAVAADRVASLVPSAAARPVAADEGTGGSGQLPFTINLRTDAVHNTVPTGTSYSLVVDASGGTPPFTFAVDRFLPVGPVSASSYTFVAAGTSPQGDSLLCPGELTYRARAADATGELARSDPLTITVISRLDFAIDLDDRLPMLDDPLLRLVRPNLYGAHPPYTLTWEFDDGTEPVTRPNRQRHDNGVFHRFPAPGSYHVRASVVDNCTPPQRGTATELLRVAGVP